MRHILYESNNFRAKKQKYTFCCIFKDKGKDEVFVFISRLLWCTSSLHHHQKQTTIIIFGYTPFSNKLSSSSRIKKPSRRVKSSQVNSLLNSTNSCGLEFSSCSKSKHAKLQEKKVNFNTYHLSFLYLIWCQDSCLAKSDFCKLVT